MKNELRFESLAQRQKHAEEMHAALQAEGTFASQLAARSMDFHISDLREQQQESLDKSALKEVIEVRLFGHNVNSGSAPINLISSVLKELGASIQRAATKLTTGKDSSRASAQLKSMLDLRFAGTAPGSTRVLMTANSLGDLAGNITHDTFEELFQVLNSHSDESFIEHAANIGTNATGSIHSLVRLLAKQGLNVEITWPNAQDDCIRRWYASSHELNSFSDKFNAMDIKSTQKLLVKGHVSLLSEHGKLHFVSEGKEIKSIVPPELIDTIKSLHLGQEFEGEFEVTTIGNSNLDFKKVSYSLSELSS
ncbi:hypothetical protein ACXHQ0_23990 [Vibrio antiquarius]